MAKGVIQNGKALLRRGKGVTMGDDENPCGCCCPPCDTGETLPETITITLDGIVGCDDSWLNGEPIVLEKAPGPRRQLIRLSFESCYGSGAAARVDEPDETAGGIGSISMIDQGEGYAIVARIEPTAGVESDPIFTPVWIEDADDCDIPFWTLDSITVDPGGSGYTDGQSVSLSGDYVIDGSAPTLIVTTIREEPTVTATVDGAGTGATLSVTLDSDPGPPELWSVDSISVSAGGSGYSDNDPVEFDYGTGGTVITDAVAKVRTIRSAPTVTASVVSGTGSGCTLSVTLTESTDGDGRAVWTVTSLTIDNPGSGYVVSNDIDFAVSPGEGDSADAYVSSVDGGGGVTGVTISDPGSYFVDTGEVDIVVVTNAGSFFGDTGEPESVSVESTANFWTEDPEAEPYVADVDITITQQSPSSGTEAVLSAVIDDDPESPTFGQMTGVTVDTAGTGYIAYTRYSNDGSRCRYVHRLCRHLGDGLDIVLNYGGAEEPSILQVEGVSSTLYELHSDENVSNCDSLNFTLTGQSPNEEVTATAVGGGAYDPDKGNPVDGGEDFCQCCGCKPRYPEQLSVRVVNIGDGATGGVSDRDFALFDAYGCGPDPALWTIQSVFFVSSVGNYRLNQQVSTIELETPAICTQVENNGCFVQWRGYTTPVRVPTNRAISGPGCEDGSMVYEHIVSLTRGSISTYVAIEGGSGEGTGYAEIDGVDGTGSITGIAVIDPGSGYAYEEMERIEPTLDLSITTSGGTGATFSISLLTNGDDPETWKIDSVSVTTPGTGYGFFDTAEAYVTDPIGGVDFAAILVLYVTRVEPTLSISGGDGTGADIDPVLIADVDFNGKNVWRIDSVTINDGGAGYTESTNLTVNIDAGEPGFGWGAILVPRVTRSEPTTLTVSVSSIDGSGADLEVVLTPGTDPYGYDIWEVTSITINDGGFGYDDFDSVSINLGGAIEQSPAYGYVEVDGSGTITSITLYDGGRYYETDGVIVAVDIDDNGEYAHTDGTIDTIEVDPYSPGAYWAEQETGEVIVDPPDVTVETNSAGSGAVLTPVIDDDPDSPTFGQITSITVTSAGADYKLDGYFWEIELSSSLVTSNVSVMEQAEWAEENRIGGTDQSGQIADPVIFRSYDEEACGMDLLDGEYPAIFGPVRCYAAPDIDGGEWEWGEPDFLSNFFRARDFGNGQIAISVSTGG